MPVSKMIWVKRVREETLYYLVEAPAGMDEDTIRCEVENSDARFSDPDDSEIHRDEFEISDRRVTKAQALSLRKGDMGISLCES